MATNETKAPASHKETQPEKTGFFQRIFTKLDDSMKAKADEKAQNGCCSGKDDKGNKCC